LRKTQENNSSSPWTYVFYCTRYTFLHRYKIKDTQWFFPVHVVFHRLTEKLAQKMIEGQKNLIWAMHVIHRERHHISHALGTTHQHTKPIKAHTPTSMWAATTLTQIKEPLNG